MSDDDDDDDDNNGNIGVAYKSTRTGKREGPDDMGATAVVQVGTKTSSKLKYPTWATA